jgi:ABC-type transporter Mla subunit MlaD
MANSNYNHFKAGLFILISFSIACAIFFGITGSALFSGPMHRFTAVFDLGEDVSGLQPGSDVRIGGFKVGTVQNVTVIVDKDGEPHTSVVFKTPARYKLRKDAVIAVQAGLTGSVNLNIANLGKGEEADENFPLNGKPDALTTAIAGFGNISDKVNQTLGDWGPRGTAALDQIKTAAATADETIKQVKSKIEPAYDKYAGVADSTRGAMKSLDEVLGDTKGDIRKTLANFGNITDALRTRVPTVMDKVADNLDSLKVSLDKTTTILDDAKVIAAETRGTAASARRLVNENRTRIDDILKSLSFTSQTLASASSEIRHAPWRLLYKPSEGEVANQNLYDAARQFADASRKLKDSAQALRDSTAQENADAASVQAMLDRLNADFANYQKVEATLWENVRK